MCRLTGQRFLQRAAGNDLEDRVMPECIVIVLIFVISENPENARPCHFEKRMSGVPGIPRVLQSVRELPREPQRFIKFPYRKQPRIGRQLSIRSLNDDRFTSDKPQRTLLDGRWIHFGPPCCRLS